ncbi:hypothetical protein [Archangium lansingense]|uniref:DUF3592 domain-containing protein n=1 Tax=Archangium lansingense TaxID=2995310 RepID=A0ABT3ZY44_9BACT|nr:hypothetical protein [Archangium lansinium]MCY1074324.1 hypothetical protein [Archangium lansinium]
MKKTVPPARLLAEALRGLSWLACLAFLVMWPFSYGFYTSFGIDMDRVQEGSRVRSHHRLRWPGDGSFWMGGEAFWLPDSEPVDPFDLGGAFFQAPRRPKQRSAWNKVGFWLFRGEHPKPTVPVQAATYARSFWVGVPSWLPPLLLGFWPVRRWVRRRRLGNSPESR